MIEEFRAVVLACEEHGNQLAKAGNRCMEIYDSLATENKGFPVPPAKLGEATYPSVIRCDFTNCLELPKRRIWLKVREL